MARAPQTAEWLGIHAPIFLRVEEKPLSDPDHIRRIAELLKPGEMVRDADGLTLKIARTPDPDRTEPLTFRPELDAIRCSSPGCEEEHGPIVIVPHCHDAAPVWPTYHEGELRLTCAECDRWILTVAIAG